MRNFFYGCLVLAGCLTSHASFADDKYVVQIFSYEGSPEALPLSSDSWGHSFLGAVKLHRESGGIWKSEGPVKSLSWYPDSLQVDLRSRVPVKATALSLARTGDEGTRGRKRQFGRSEVFEISKDLFDALDPHVTDLLNHCRYALVRSPSECAFNCIDAIHAWVDKQTEDAPPFSSGLAHGSVASARLVGWMQAAGVVIKVNNPAAASTAARILQAELGVESGRLTEIKPRDDFKPLILRPHRAGTRPRASRSHDD